MRFRPLFLVPDHDSDDAVPGSTTDFDSYTDEQLLDERERQQRTRSQVSLRAVPPWAESDRLAATDDPVEQINEELIRRARQRHPSARGRAG